MSFGQIVVGPPGSGKTTYCHGMKQFYTATNRPVAIINLDPANDGMPYTPDIDISELITLEDTMEEFGLGPNGGLIYCIEYLEKNMDWLQKKLADVKDKYLLFDCPGQVELFTHHSSLKNIIEKLSKSMDIRLCCTHLVDAHYCVDPSKYVALLLLSLKTMIQLELPHVNVLSKLDLMESYGETAFNLEFYTEVQDLDYLLDRLNEGAFGKKYYKLNQALCDLVKDYSLVGFHTLAIEDTESVMNLAQAIDKANGYIYGLDMNNDSPT
ncbi:GPN-loop GTPase [Powellomyces hirtus]|nr:GPN-loop GTPase [Powellomyces hirtus]